MPQKTPLALIILDGFGYVPEREGNAIAQAQMPFYNELLEKYPHTLLHQKVMTIDGVWSAVGSSVDLSFYGQIAWNAQFSWNSP